MSRKMSRKLLTVLLVLIATIVGGSFLQYRTVSTTADAGENIDGTNVSVYPVEISAGKTHVYIIKNGTVWYCTGTVAHPVKFAE